MTIFSYIQSFQSIIRYNTRAEKQTSTDDWVTMVEEGDWRDRHDKARLDKKDVKLEEVLAASASDDGTVRLWKPLEVRD